MRSDILASAEAILIFRFGMDALWRVLPQSCDCCTIDDSRRRASLHGCESLLGANSLVLSSTIYPSFRADGQKCLVANASITSDEVLIAYDGAIIDHSTRYSIQIDDHKHIEGTPESNAYLNHSCEPNAYVDWSGVYLRALRNISAGEEFT